MVLLQPRRLAFGSGAYWRHRRRVVIDRMRQEGWIGEVGPGGQVLWQEQVGEPEARRWWRRAEAGPRGAVIALLLAVAAAAFAHGLEPRSPRLTGLAAGAPLLGYLLFGFARRQGF